ncbi:G-type lectin S-receptor-like serine/threonine-protein kinase At2g19130 [Malania oleifera]|uniref:G-type lectin S-receptor-like serine/threonine-protein kinase At2g19130 n=1 Tax=Malania oleifera TaxID=397392 RepID=UPI0025ADC5C8|nr:G-type lectin S-receptor-like serine/threonine-protein kinase At2g19130 [Malania oleifera]
MAIRNFSWPILFVLFLCLCAKTKSSNITDTISIGNSLSGDQIIVSAHGEFELGFFKPGNSSYYYIGIWFKQVSVQTVVWVANRDKPLSDKYKSELKITNGNLVLFDESHIPVWSTNVKPTSSDSTKAVLFDTGNLELRDGVHSSETMWRSFDHPTDKMLPGMKIGLDKRTKKMRRLTSWRSPDDPATGIFSVGLDPAVTSQYIITWNRSVKYWASGKWDGHKYTSTPEMNTNYVFTDIIFGYNHIDNENETYFTFWCYSNKSSTKLKAMFAMDVYGFVQKLIWVDSYQQWYMFWSRPTQQCEVYGLCGPFGTCNQKTEDFCNCLPGFTPSSQKDWELKVWSDGCQRKANLQFSNDTSNGGKDWFLPMPNMRLPANPQLLRVSSVGECQWACLNNNSCTAYAFDTDGCSTWMGNLLNLQQQSEDDATTVGQTLHIRLAASEFSSKHRKETVIKIVVGSFAGAVALLGLLLVAVLKWRSFGRTRKVVDGLLVHFQYRDLQNATKKFSEKLGGGGFGSVFKGILPDSTVIAVKKLESISQGEKQFRSEVSTIGTTQHVNLVRLRGFCSEGSKRLLVYDYMPNHSLASHLFHEKHSQVLTWEKRYQILLGTARGLAYLHEKCRDCIIHCDIKPENILLDAEFCAKIADFGLAKLLGREFSRVLTTMRGTRGYLAPEWISGVPISAKADVFSYGMMLFELISGRRNFMQSEDSTVEFFPSCAAKQITDGGDVLCLLDHRLEGTADADQLSRVCRVACWCIQDDETHRPSMGRVVQILEGILDVSLPPLPRCVQAFTEKKESIYFYAELSSSQRSQARRNASTAEIGNHVVNTSELGLEEGN